MRVRESDPDVTFGQHRRTATVVAFSASVLAVLFAAALVWVVVTRNQEWTPLGPYPTQIVQGTLTYAIDGTTYPAVHVSDEAVTVTGKKCYQEAVTVSGASSWFSTQPSGLTLQTGNGVRDREAGCFTATFVNQMPAEVRVWATELFDRGRPYVVMQITGREQAIQGDRTSEPRVWRTEDFVILPDGSGK
jgi:hypothetical protein